MDSEDFTQKITKKPYPKYQFQPHWSGLKSSSNAINRAKSSINQQINLPEASEYLNEHYTHLKISKKGHCAFYTKKEGKPS